MKHLTKMADWVDLFDVVVVQARKPKFYFDTYRLVRHVCVFCRCKCVHILYEEFLLADPSDH